MQLGVPLGHCGGRQQLLDGWEVVIHEPAIRVGRLGRNRWLWAGSLRLMGASLLCRCWHARKCLRQRLQVTAVCFCALQQTLRHQPKPLLQVLLEPPLLRRPALFELYAEEASGGFTRHHLLSTLRQAYGHALADEEQQREHKRECPAAVAAPSTAQWSAAPAAQQQLILVGMQRMQQGHWVLILVS